MLIQYNIWNYSFLFYVQYYKNNKISWLINHLPGLNALLIKFYILKH